MRIDVLTLFPAMFEGVFGSSILGKARDKGLVKLNTINFRDYANNKHNTVDDAPYGGGGGMVLKPEPIFAAVEDVLGTAPACRETGSRAATGQPDAVLAESDGQADHAGQAKQSVRVDRPGLEADADGSPAGTADKRPRVILMCPQGETFTQRKAEELAGEKHLIFICGHYEGYDERIREHLVTDELSIGDYVLTGGELPAMVIIDSVVRLLPGVLGNETSAVTDSFSTGLLEYPHYTRPASFRGWDVPEVLVSGHHENVAQWRHREALRRTARRRPDLLSGRELSKQERAWLAEFEKERGGAGDGE
ncbi:tRNA (guanine-N1)-methyltransferase [Gordoniibacillus kamchatkensis]|uniref:tRNA (guanine-N(1)-)-methyltransferase n=1 Tax=Gordoniibacillus kamchatkensis TaxID=1590651 RepID=A0ABR5A650_9BACL|nr:tRNA (guanosine(37)-N1)-methyltransferase TrmD [Paenibacillus sp. VKM B-2647]KIL36570.1 tRNA (guanine-N1)-methyltransferase [Paenibacillus sp. VKM B-2647]